MTMQGNFKSGQDSRSFTLVVRRLEEMLDNEELSLTNPVPVQEVPAFNDVRGTVKQISVATTATLLAEANPRRVAIMITTITGSQIVTVGFSSGVLAANGQFMAAAIGTVLTYYGGDAIWAIASVGAQTVSVLETVHTGIQV